MKSRLGISNRILHERLLTKEEKICLNNLAQIFRVFAHEDVRAISIYAKEAPGIQGIRFYVRVMDSEGRLYCPLPWYPRLLYGNETRYSCTSLEWFVTRRVYLGPINRAPQRGIAATLVDLRLGQTSVEKIQELGLDIRECNLVSSYENLPKLVYCYKGDTLEYT